LPHIEFVALPPSLCLNHFEFKTMAANQNTLLGAKRIDEMPYILANLDSKAANKLSKIMPPISLPVISVIGKPYDVQHRCHMGPKGESPQNRNPIRLAEENGVVISPFVAIDIAQSSRVYTREQRAKRPGEATRIEDSRHQLTDQNLDYFIHKLASVPQSASSQAAEAAHPQINGSTTTANGSIAKSPLNMHPVTKQTVWVVRNSNNEISQSASQSSMRTTSTTTSTTAPNIIAATPVSKNRLSNLVQMVDQSTQTDVKTTNFGENNRQRAVQDVPQSTQTELERLLSSLRQDRETQENRIQRMESEMQALRLQQNASDIQIRDLQAHRCPIQRSYIPMIPTPAESTYLSNLREARRVRDVTAEWKQIQLYNS
jgi:hypothetical protein